jgi:ketosteroid isomerase-like protein
MSQENVEIVKRAWEAWHRDDLAANLDLLDPDVKLYRIPEGARDVS